jgi:hypothetical protein
LSATRESRARRQICGSVVEHGPDAVGASLIGAGMISVLLFPLLGTRIAEATARTGHVSGESDEY